MNGASKTIQSAFDHHELVERMMGNATIAQRMLGKFLCNGPADVDLMESTIRMGSSADIAALAHRHRGTAKTLAAPRIAELSALIERQSREGSLSDLLATVDQLRLAHEELQQAFDEWVQEEADSGANS